MADDPLARAFAPFDAIREAIRAAVEPLGVHFLTWNITPGDGDEGDERVCEILMAITPDAFMSDEAKQTSQAIAEMEREEKALDRAEELRDQTEETRKKLIEMQKRGGIFSDSPEE